ncbi:MAG: c-type cytochrome [Bacteroidetes bacterium]|nr:c-type cytochrome [Bacteroidota bacterium]
MKKVLGTIVAVVVLMACGSGEGKKEATATAATETKAVAAAPKPLSENPDYQKGLALVAGSDCLTCHKTSEKLIGPAYKDVAAKYEATESNIKMLASKVIKGGSGVWGAIPMTPHPQIKVEDAEAMVKYVLLLKK